MTKKELRVKLARLMKYNPAMAKALIEKAKKNKTHKANVDVWGQNRIVIR